ncbi:MAG: hypothetical protein EOP69_00810, partial [Spirochaetia bacterium]
MTATLPCLHLRDGVYQYERRVPLGVQRDRSFFAARFAGRPLFRRSLRTKCKAEAALAWRAAHQTFETLLARPVASVTEQRAYAPLRAVTDHDLAAIAERYKALTADPFETLHRRANVDLSAAAELARMESNLQMDAEDIAAALRSRDPGIASPVLQPSIEASFIIAEQGFYAPEGSDLRGAIIGAVRSGLEQGYRHVTALSNGDVVPRLGTTNTPSQPVTSITLADAVNRYVSDRQLPVKAVSEICLALRQFEEVIGRKSLSSLTKADAANFIAHLSEQKVGGKTKESVVRRLSHQSIAKRLRMLATAINHANACGLYDQDNPLTLLKLRHHLKAPDKAIMPDKRRLQISELNTLFTHPWFTGCASPNDRYNAGSYRLSGSEFWVPIVALFTGCRAAELGGLKVTDVRLEDSHPHLIVRDNEYRRTKAQRTRRVPILDALIALGFPAYVNRIREAGHDRLFPDWTARLRKGAGQGDDP